jgi:membrane-associated phospholipid phosphatase
LAIQRRLTERETSHTLALMNMVAYDGLVASHEAKYFYWLLRPTMADPGITLAVPLPNFPSYPSNHATISSAMARVIGARFPTEARRVDAMADEAALSRVLGGIHYRFDGEAGLTLGRTVAAWALAHDVEGHEPFVLR